MDWLIWVIVIVLVVAILWWRMSRTGSGSQAPSSPESRGLEVETAGLTATAPPPPRPVHSGAEDSPGADADVPAAESDAGSEAATSEDPVGAAAPDAEKAPVTAAPEEMETVTAPEEVAGVASVEPSPVEEEATLLAEEGRMEDAAEWEASWTDAAGSSVPAPAHHNEYTDPHAPTLPGAESAAAEETGSGAPREGDSAALPSTPEPAPQGGHLAAEQPYGAGSATAADDGSGPEGLPVKGDPESMTYYDEDHPGYAQARAGVWFESTAHAEAAGFRPPRRNRG